MDRLTRVQFGLGSSCRRPTALDLGLLMAVIVVCLVPMMHPIAVDITLMASIIWAMRNSR